MAKGSAHEVATEGRLRGAVWGQFVGDAAALGTHWIYDLSELSARFPDGIFGFEAPAAGTYHESKKPGDQTHYGDGALVLLESIAEHGRFDPRAFGKSFVETFESPQYLGYLDYATLGTLKNYKRFRESNSSGDYDFQQGADDAEPATASRLAGLAVRYWRDSNFPATIESLTRVCQNNRRAIGYMKFHGLLLEELFLGREVYDGLENAMVRIGPLAPDRSSELRQQTQKAVAEIGKEVTEAVLEFGQACPLTQSFPSALHAFLKHSDNFEAAILATLRAGGDNAGRGTMLGSWLGAHLGVNSIPREWRTRLTAGPRIATALDKILLDEARGRGGVGNRTRE
ncbi:MAG: ADP-ribosylglycohydrolase family protein [Verrucomicrobia bacterium]|nr:ADP-ribosylglycohydrolase family protein [Verrucomicrobiota bacterium]